MQPDLEVELKFLVPRSARKALAVEMARPVASMERRLLSAMYFDTPDRRLAQAGIAWRLRREGRRWVQTLKAAGSNSLERFEHEVDRPGASIDPALHAGTPAGDRLLKLLGKGEPVGLRYRTDVRRLLRRVRTRGAVVEIAFDEGSILAEPLADSGAPARLRLCELEFELLSGSVQAMLAMAERWRKRFGLIVDPRSKGERGDRLADGVPFPPLRKARVPGYRRDASAIEAFGAVLDECLDHIVRNAIGLVDGDPALRVEHVHQLRVGIRRLRSGLRSFRGWVPAAPQPLVDGLRQLFGTLGLARDSDVLDAGVALSLAEAGAPPLAPVAVDGSLDLRAVVGDAEVQRLLLAWLAWRAGLALAETDSAPAGARKDEPDAAGESAAPALGCVAGEADGEAGAAAEGVREEANPRGPAFRRRAQRRLRRWHQAIAEVAQRFDTLDDVALHDLRKWIKRQRYAAEFFAPVLQRKSLVRYLKQVSAVQARLGELNDLLVARERYQDLLAQDPAAWFALGWLAARIDELRRRVRPELDKLVRLDLPSTRRLG